MKNFEDNEELIIALKKCDENAYEYIYKKYYNELFFFALSYMLSKEEIHDTIHDTFVAMLENADKISIHTEIKGYLYLTVKNICLNKLKHYNVVTKNHSKVVESLRFDKKNNNYDKEKLEYKVSKLTKQLSDQQQNVIRLKTLGKSYEEIAEELNISKLTVSVHVKRAYKYIRDNILVFFTF